MIDIRSIKIPLTIAIIGLVLSFIPILYLFIIFCCDGAISLFDSFDGIHNQTTHYVISSFVYGIISLLTLFGYYKSVERWKEIVFAILSFCFLTVLFFPWTLKLFSQIEPPYLLDFIVTTIFSSLLLITVGLMKSKNKK